MRELEGYERERHDRYIKGRESDTVKWKLIINLINNKK